MKTNSNIETFKEERPFPVINLEFLKLLSHDLKGPIHNMTLGIELLKQSRKLPKNDPYVEVLDNSLEQMQEMVSYLLELAITEDRDRAPQCHLVPVYKFVEGILYNFKVRARIRNISLRTRFLGNHDLAYFDRSQVQRILENLIENALKYSEPNSKIEVIVTRNHQSISFHVVDEGIGVPDSQRASLFRPLQKGIGKPLDGTQSIGLGLALCASLVSAQNGEIGFKPRRKKGSCFFFRIPQI